MDPDERRAAEQRLRLLELLERAMSRRAEVFEIVGSSEDLEEALLHVTELLEVAEPHGAELVLDLRLARWTGDERRRIVEEADELRAWLAT